MIEFHDAPERSRYEIEVDGAPAGFAHYRLREGSVVLDHTVIREEFAGQGLASHLVRAALDAVRAQQGRIVPVCPYVAGWLAKNPDYDDLVDRDLLAQIRAAG